MWVCERAGVGVGMGVGVGVGVGMPVGELAGVCGERAGSDVGSTGRGMGGESRRRQGKTGGISLRESEIGKTRPERKGWV